MKQIELISKRKPREKHFLQEDGTIIAKIYDDDIHFLENGKYEEIDNQLIKENDYYINRKNSYKVKFKESSKEDLMKMEVNEHFLDIKLKENKETLLKKVLKHSKIIEDIKYEDILDNIDFEYRILPRKVKESIIIKEKNKIPSNLLFDINTNLKLYKNNDKSIGAYFDNKQIFKIDAPYMMDAEGKINKNIYYELKNQEEKYELTLVLDKEWLESNNTIYPVIIDPTISNSSLDENVYDTYIYPGDTGIDKNSQDILKAGVEQINGNNRVNRTLMKFNLPELGTGSQVISAQLTLIGYHSTDTSYASSIMEIRRLTAPWDESTANWDNMNNQYDSTRIDGCFMTQRSYLDVTGTVYPQYSIADITDLVKNWYKDTPNNGIMIKSATEVYNSEILPAFYSKNNSIEGFNPKPILEIVYRNQNGLEPYMKYTSQKYHSGSSHINLYNGNLTALFDVGSLSDSKIPVELKLVYNTNNVILNNDYGCGLGVKFNLYQTIKSVTIDDEPYLELLDEDGTIHYFTKTKKTYNTDGNIVIEEEENTYYDEDGLQLKITENTTFYLLIDKFGYEYKFNKKNGIGYISEFKNLRNEILTINYNNQNLITEIIDTEGNEINISYNENNVSIITPNKTYTLTLLNNKLININSILGNIQFNYDSNNLISKIVDTDGKSIAFEYYSQSPYRAKKVIEYGVNNGTGRILNIDYKFSSTTIKDNENKTRTYTFNKFGNVISTTNLKGNNDLTNSYGKYHYVGQNYQDKNKINYSKILLGYVKNFFINSIFEKDETIFSSSAGTALEVSSDFSYIGSNSLKVVNNSTNSYIIKEIEVPKGDSYTFSVYTKNTNKIRLALAYIASNGIEVEEQGEIIESNESFERSDISIHYPEDAVSNLKLKIYLITIGTVYIDAVQLEIGEIANIFNYVENSDFSDGLTGWTTYGNSNNYEIVELDNSKKALKIKMDPSLTTSIDRTLEISGGADDKYTICFWFKNQGLHADGVDAGGSIYNNVSINFNYDDDYGHGIALSATLEPNNDEWQFFTSDFIATRAYNSIDLSFLQIMNANDLYITNICLYKNINSCSKEYDENGNLIKVIGLENDENRFEYDNNNQLILMKDSLGNISYYEYDNKEKDKLICGTTALSINNESKYDVNGNIISTKIINRGQSNEIVDGLYKIRCKGTKEYVKVQNKNIVITENSDEYCKWEISVIEKYGEKYYKFRYPLINDKFLSVETNTADLYTDIEEYTLFSLIKNKNGSYRIKPKNKTSYLRKFDSELWLYQSEADEPDYEFYLEKCDEDLFIEKNYNYKEDGKTIKSITESTFAISEYELDNNGLITKISEPNGKITQYDYNNKNKVTNILMNNKNINFEYNNQNLLSKVTQGNKQYIYTYNEFGKIKRVNLGDNIVFINYTYDNNNGNLIKKDYGNNDSFSFEYDGFNRLSKVTKKDDICYIKYDANGNLAKIKSNNILKRYSYSLSQMLIEAKNNELKLKYIYDNCNNLITKNIYYENTMVSILNNEYNKDNSIIKSQFDDNKVEYFYDKLGRIYEKRINNTYITNYKYVTNGKRSTTLLNYIKNGDDSYSYKYNKLNKITHIYHNDLLEQRYYYDQMNELVREDNFVDNLTIRYKYDISGNIISKKYYKLNTYDLIKKNIYQYNNLQWEDQLTKFNNTEIIYDNIGNPLSLGTNITLNWKNGNELETYSDATNLIKYDYDEIGIRTSKIINGIKTNYYTEGKKIILEKTGNNMIYYLRDDVDNLIGFRYNNELYYYIKDLQDNIIGITDSSHNIIAKYRYDATGNILTITDENGNDVSNNHNHIANINPFRYRSYYFDKETGLYYLNTRYYNPLWGRFLNADKYINANKDYLGHNLYAYVSNDFINNVDEDGTSILSGITRKIWNFVASILKKKDMPVSSELLKHSAQSKPSDIHYGKNSSVAKAIEEDPAYQKQLDKAIKSADEKGNVEYRQTFAFTKTDLQGSFNNATITVTGTVIDDEVDLKVQIYDIYDFKLEIESYGKGGMKWFIFTAGNNLAYLDQLTGTINNYDVYVDIDYKYCLVK